MINIILPVFYRGETTDGKEQILRDGFGQLEKVLSYLSKIVHK